VLRAVGLLDRVHWEHRAFVKMAYNGGSRGLTALGAAASFAGATAVLGEAVAAALVSVVIAAVVATALDVTFAVGLDACRGRPVGAGLREVVEVDALDLPLAVFGGAVGSRRRGRLVKLHGPLVGLARPGCWVGGSHARAAGAVSVWSCRRVSWPLVRRVVATICLLIAMPIAVGWTGGRRGCRSPVAPGVVVVMSVRSAKARRRPGALVAAGATAVSWWSSHHGQQGRSCSRSRLLRERACCGAGGARRRYEAVLVAARPGRGDLGSPGAVVARATADRSANLVWTVPLAAGARWPLRRGWMRTVRSSGVRGARRRGNAPGAVRFDAVAGSSYPRRLGGAREPVVPRWSSLRCGGIALDVAVVVGGARHPWLLGRRFAGESACVMAQFVTRQWQFVPRARTRAAACTATAAIVALIATTQPDDPTLLLGMGAVVPLVAVVAARSSGRADRANPRRPNAARSHDR
jgi:hypothetical protein